MRANTTSRHVPASATAIRLTTPDPSPCGTPTCFLTADHLGSTRLLTDSTGQVKRRYDYMPFGEQIIAGTGGRTIEMGYEGAQSGVTQRFTGKERDTETGLDYFLARYYSGAQGRFTTPDAPFADQHVGDPQSWNLYAYVGNNPLKYVDPTGRGKISTFYKVITKVTGEGRVYKKVTNIPLSRDEARRLFRKEGQDVFGSRKGAKNVAGRGAIEDPVHGRGLGDNNPHFHDKDRSGGHSFYEGAGIAIPGAEFGKNIFGDNLVGEAVDFFNPLSDLQTAVDLIQTGVESLQQRYVDLIKQQMRRGAQIPCPACDAAAEESRKKLEEAERKRQKCGQHGEVCPDSK